MSESASSPLEGVLALGPEEVDVRLELQLEDVVLVDTVGLLGRADSVAQQGETGEWEVVLQVVKHTNLPSVRLQVFSKNVIPDCQNSSVTIFSQWPLTELQPIMEGYPKSLLHPFNQDYMQNTLI